MSENKPKRKVVRTLENYALHNNGKKAPKTINKKEVVQLVTSFKPSEAKKEPDSAKPIENTPTQLNSTNEQLNARIRSELHRRVTEILSAKLEARRQALMHSRDTTSNTTWEYHGEEKEAAASWTGEQRGADLTVKSTPSSSRPTATQSKPKSYVNLVRERVEKLRAAEVGDHQEPLELVRVNRLVAVPDHDRTIMANTKSAHATRSGKYVVGGEVGDRVRSSAWYAHHEDPNSRPGLIRMRAFQDDFKTFFKWCANPFSSLISTESGAAMNGEKNSTNWLPDASHNAELKKSENGGHDGGTLQSSDERASSRRRSSGVLGNSMGPESIADIMGLVEERYGKPLTQEDREAASKRLQELRNQRKSLLEAEQAASAGAEGGGNHPLHTSEEDGIHQQDGNNSFASQEGQKDSTTGNSGTENHSGYDTLHPKGSETAPSSSQENKEGGVNHSDTHLHHSDGVDDSGRAPQENQSARVPTEENAEGGHQQKGSHKDGLSNSTGPSSGSGGLPPSSTTVDGSTGKEGTIKEEGNKDLTSFPSFFDQKGTDSNGDNDVTPLPNGGGASSTGPHSMEHTLTEEEAGQLHTNHNEKGDVESVGDDLYNSPNTDPNAGDLHYPETDVPEGNKSTTENFDELSQTAITGGNSRVGSAESKGVLGNLDDTFSDLPSDSADEAKGKKKVRKGKDTLDMDQLLAETPTTKDKKTRKPKKKKDNTDQKELSLSSLLSDDEDNQHLDLFLANFPDTDSHVKLRKKAKGIIAVLDVEASEESDAEEESDDKDGPRARRRRMRFANNALYGFGGKRLSDSEEVDVSGFDVNEEELNKRFNLEAQEELADLFALRRKLAQEVYEQSSLLESFKKDVYHLSKGKDGMNKEQFALELTKDVNRFARQHRLRLSKMLEDATEENIEEVAEGFLSRFGKGNPDAKEVGTQVTEQDLGYLDEGVRQAESRLNELYYHEKGLIDSIKLTSVAVANIMSFHASLELEATCKECFYIFESPRTLWPCGHTFCLPCLAGMYNRNEELVCAECGSLCEIGYTPNLTIELVANYQLIREVQPNGAQPKGGGRTIESVLRSLLSDLISTQHSQMATLKSSASPERIQFE